MTAHGTRARSRTPLTRERVLRAAVGLADGSGIESVSMRRLGHALGVEAMSLYNHVASKDDLLDGMCDLVWGEIELPVAGGRWREAIRATAISAHDVLVRHPWAPSLVMARPGILAARIRYMEAILRAFREGGCPPELTFHAYHAVDSHVIGFTLWQLGHTLPPGDPDELKERLVRELAPDHPYLVEHAEQHFSGFGREGEGEFAFVLDLLLDGLERVQAAG
ncbi:MAG TPA: TetR/AcrR family transcriptional regulator C-terminal domain-containing protein [Gaiellaceae bacterium]|nr:TetR/AcrR family transcriptional regulator C-terminal domain-containing protein [Gaiellaceae bacterium]